MTAIPGRSTRPALGRRTFLAGSLSALGLGLTGCGGGGGGGAERADDPEGRHRAAFQGRVESVRVEQSGPVRAVVLATGRHTDGRPTLGAPDSWRRIIRHVPTWNDWTLEQLSADGYTVRKRTGRGHGWITVPGGTRSRGYAYLGSGDGGLEMGLRGFWQSHPTQIDVRDAATDVASLTTWLWSPEARPMDVRFYHDGEHQRTRDEQREAVGVTYEDYKPGFGDAHGVGRTHELTLRAAGATADHASLDARADACARPPQLVCPPERIKAAGVFGTWSLPDRSSATAAAIEDRLDLLVDHYRDQVDERRWYGFWDYGDIMHTYDADRHTWRYDIGGYAWANSEFSPDLWLWLSFLRTGDAATFRLAEAMTRHTGEVDVYHAGPFAGFGTRHNVQHWGCSCKQLRVSSAVYRRFHHFLTADERTGELLDEVAVTDQTLIDLDRNRAVGSRKGLRPLDPGALEVDLGIDYGALLASWLTQWERTGDPLARRRIVETMTDIGRMPRRYLTGIAHFDTATGRFDTTGDRRYISHLSALFGIVEVVTEILDLVDVPEFEAAWLDFCRLCLAPAEQQETETWAVWLDSGEAFSEVPHTRLLAWAAHKLGDRNLAERAWRIFLTGAGNRKNLNELDPDRLPVHVQGPNVAEPVTELPGVTTNDAAQYGLAAIQNLALIGESLEDVRRAL
ncbi:Tat pathway signal sequence domain protein [Streptomyces radicis]|uniref:exo-rhamnogalacturonan lyase family protein n=1 Tax=Streptomyces radicis TaxID=1750517 RepID=UPI0015FFA9D3|nr:Tat pathway signal sequence domain protein [Streptomyces radicis]